MEASRAKGLPITGSAASRVAYLDKENICPSLSSIAPVGTSRSPLPEGFPRAPLQDITDVLSPINILPNDEDEEEKGLCRPRRKRSKCVGDTKCVGGTRASGSMTRCDYELNSSEMKWTGLRRCVTVQVAVRNVHDAGESKLAKGVEAQDQANLVESVGVQGHVASTDGESEVPVSGALKMEMREADNMLSTETISVAESGIEAEIVESSSLVRSLKTMPGRQHKLSSPSLATRASLRSAQGKPKMSSIMKFR